MAHHMVHRGADGFRETAVIEVRGNRFQLVHDEVVAALIEFLGRRPGLDEGFDHIQDAGGQAAGGAHFVLFSGVLMVTVIGEQALFPVGVHGIKRGYF